MLERISQYRTDGQNLIQIDADYKKFTGGTMGILKTVLKEEFNSVRISVASRFAPAISNILDKIVPERLIESRVVYFLHSTAQRLIDPDTDSEHSNYPFHLEDGIISPNTRVNFMLRVLSSELRFRNKNKETKFDLGSQSGMSSTQTDKRHIGNYMARVREFFSKSQTARFLVDMAETEILGILHEAEETKFGDESILLVHRRNNNQPNVNHDSKMLKTHMKKIRTVVDYLIPESVPYGKHLSAYWAQVLSIYDHYSIISDEARYAPLIVLLDRIFDMADGNHFWFEDKREQTLRNIYGGDECNTDMLKIVRERFKDREIEVIPEFSEDDNLALVHKHLGQYYTVKVKKWHTTDNLAIAKEQKDVQEKKINRYLELMKTMGVNHLLIKDINDIILAPLIAEAKEFGIDISFKI